MNSLTRRLAILLLVLSSLFQAHYLYAATEQVRVNNNNDDAEERVSDGDMYRDSTDLELGYDPFRGGTQIVGIRFRNVDVPQGATINSAYIEFETDETDSGTTNLVIYGQDVDDANRFNNSNNNVSSRAKTTASVNWSPAAWNTRNEKQQTPSIASIVQEIVNRAGWAATNDMVFMIEPGAGCNNSNCQRTAESHDGESSAAPLLVIDYTVGGATGALSGNMNVDNRFTAYISTSDSVQGTQIGSGTDWRTTESIATNLASGQDYYLHIFAEDTGGPAGFLGDFTLSGGTHVFENGATTLTTNTANWRVSRTGWSNYVNASGYGQNGVSPWGLRSGVDASAEWIWSSDNNAHNTVYFTTRISPPSSYSVVSVHGACGADNLLLVEFDSVIDANALLPTYYTLSSGTVNSVTQQSNNVVVLSVSGVVAGQSYTLTVNGADHGVDFSGLTGHYFDQRSSGSKVSRPAGLFTGAEFIRKDAQLNFSWNNATPTIFPNISGNGDRFSIRWNGYIVPSQAGSYEFRIYSDDGMRVDLDSNQILNDWSDHAPRYSSASATQALSSGVGYPLAVEYYENTGRAYAQLQWRLNGGAWQAIPAANLSSCAVTGAAPAAVIEYRMDETAWSGAADEVVDSSGNDNHGTALNDLSTGSNAHLCRAGQFDGIDDYITSPNIGSTLRGTSSLSFWIKTTQTGNNTGWRAPGVTGVEQSGGADDIFWGWIDSGGNIGISVGDDYSSKSTVSINDGSFHHVVLTRDAVSGAYKIYIDGTLNRSGFIAAGIIGNNFSSIGRIEDTGGSPEYFEGQLDELKVYDSVLNDTHVLSLYNESRSCGASQPLAHFTFEQANWTGAGVVIDDDSGSNNSGSSLGNTQTDANGYYCKGVSIPDNASSAIIDAINSRLDVDTEIGSQGTAMMWYRAEQDWIGSGNRTLMDASTAVIGNGNDKYFYFAKMDDGRLRFALEDSSDRDFNTYSSVNSFAAGTWVHLAITWDFPANNVKIYVNGAQAVSNNISSNGALGDVGDLYFGDNSSTYAAYGRSAYGSIDDIRIYDSELSITEINVAMADATICSSCTLGGFAITQPSVGLACSSTRSQISIQAMCADGVTQKTDYAGTINLNTNESANSEFYSAVTGGTSINSITLNGTENGLGNVYLFHKNENSNVLVSAADAVSGTSSTASTGTDFRAQGFLVSSPANFTCGTSTEQFSLTAYGQTQDGSAACAVITGFTGNKSLRSWFEVNYDPDESPELGDAAAAPLILGSDAVSATTRPASTNLGVEFNAGVATFSVGHLDAAHVLNVNFEHDDGVLGTPDLIGTSSSFVVYPAGIEVSAISANSDCASGDHNCSAFVAAGDDFSMQLRAYCADAPTTTAQSYQTPTGNNISLVSNLVAPSGGDNASLSVSGAALTSTDSGMMTIVNQQIDEVGVFTVTSTAPNYFAQAIPSSTSPNIGRFVPSSFDVAVGAADFAAGCTAVSPFHYMNQTFTWNTTPQISIRALNASGAVTENYEGDFWNLGSALQVDSNCSGLGSARGFCYADNAGNAASLIYPNASIAFGDVSNANGQVLISMTHQGLANFSYDRPAGTNITPFNADIDLDIRLQDSDSVSGLGSLNNIGFQLAAEMRQGRWKMENAYGPETQALRMKAYPEFFNSSSTFVIHTDDQCTNVTATTTPAPSGGSIAVGSGTTSLTINSPLNDNLGENFVFSSPGVSNTGSVSIDVDLSAIPWLRYDWDGDGVVEDHPIVEAQFGQYRGHDRIIYWREVSN